jgi:hypothetical protein
MADTCRKCGQTHPGCTAHRSRKVAGLLQPCNQTRGLQSVAGGRVCPTHGGQVPKVKAATNRAVQLRKAEQTAAQMVVDYLGQVDGDPLANLARMVLVSAQAERAYAGLLEAEGELIDYVSYGVQGTRKEPSVYLKLWNEERDRLAKFSKAALDAGIAEAQLDFARTAAAGFAAIFVRVLGDLGLPPETVIRARELYAQQLRLQAPGG